MELTPQDNERLKKIAIAGILTVAAYELVKYRRTGERVGHVYRLPSRISDTGSFIIGVISDGKEGMSRLSGIFGLNQETGEFDKIELDESAGSLTPEQVENLEVVYPTDDLGDSSD